MAAVSAAEYWVEIWQDDQRLGAGFLLTKRYVLTALHCLKDISPENDEVRITFAGRSGHGLLGRVNERATEADMALIWIVERAPLVVPIPDRCAIGDLWHGPYRPCHSDPYLGGTVAHESFQYKCESGSVIEALQLAVREDFGDYSGYSGGPVERVAQDVRTSEGDGRVIGILLEQYPDRQAEGRASRTLFAATIAEAVRRFDCFDVGHLIDDLHPTASTRQGTDLTPVSRETSEIETAIVKSTRLLQAIHEWGDGGLLDAPQVAALKLRIAENLINGGSE
jgi:hypothetical protein